MNTDDIRRREAIEAMRACFRRGCDVCGVMNWRVTASGNTQCECCGNLFDKTVEATA